MADLLIKAKMKYFNKELYLLSSCKGESTRKKAKCLMQIHNRNEAEEGRRGVKLAEVCPVWSQRGQTRETCHVLYQSLKARLSCFP